MRLKESIDKILSRTDQEFATAFYGQLFERHPELHGFFQKTDMRKQHVMLTMALQIFVYHHSNPNAAMDQYIRVLGRLHDQIGIPAEELYKFRNVLLDFMKVFHGQEWSDNLEGEWAAALDGAIALMKEL